jgi:hypothetical protein
LKHLEESRPVALIAEDHEAQLSQPLIGDDVAYDVLDGHLVFGTFCHKTYHHNGIFSHRLLDDISVDAG